MTLAPSSPAPGSPPAEPDPLGIDSDLESALLDGLSNTGDDSCEGPPGLAFAIDSGFDDPAREGEPDPSIPRAAEEPPGEPVPAAEPDPEQALLELLADAPGTEAAPREPARFGPDPETGLHLEPEADAEPDEHPPPSLDERSAPTSGPEPDPERARLDGVDDAPGAEAMAEGSATSDPETGPGIGAHTETDLDAAPSFEPAADFGNEPAFETEPDLGRPPSFETEAGLGSAPFAESEPDLGTASALERAPVTAPDDSPSRSFGLTDPSAAPPEPDLERALLDGLDDAPGAEAMAEGSATSAPETGPGIGTHTETGLDATPAFEPGLGTAPTFDRTPDGPPPDYRPPSLADWSSPTSAADPDLEQALIEGLAGAADAGAAPETSELEASLGSAPSIEPESGLGIAPPFDLASPAEPDDYASPPLADRMSPAAPTDSGPERAPIERRPGALDTGAMPGVSTAFDPGSGLGQMPREEPFAPPATGEAPAAFAFATDPDTESALREGLSDHADPQVWPGDLRIAVAALAGGHSARILFLDLDETPYPAGAIHELAALCEVGTVVIALGSDGTARFSREILLAGVSDYLVKPVTAAAVREAAARAAGSAAGGGRDRGDGWSVGFAGTGGSGTTTIAAATALVAAERGRYVSVLDLNRTFPACSFLLDVEPAAGLVELLSTVARASLHPEMVDAMRAERSDRVAVYGYPWSAVPPPLPPVWAVCELLVELQRRSHLVIVDGLDDPATRLSLLAMVDARVLTFEPTVSGAARATRVLARLGLMFGEDWPSFLVRNHTRAFSRKAGAPAFGAEGAEAAPDVTVPFEPALPALADRGWPRDRLPGSLRGPVAALTDRILDSAAAGAPARA